MVPITPSASPGVFSDILVTIQYPNLLSCPSQGSAFYHTILSSVVVQKAYHGAYSTSHLVFSIKSFFGSQHWGRSNSRYLQHGYVFLVFSGIVKHGKGTRYHTIGQGSVGAAGQDGALE
jgi:hypothetical protein